MDKYEYKLKTEQMLKLKEKGAYRQAAAIADQIDWRRVRNVTTLITVSDIYENSKEYQKSYDVLRIAYHRAEGSRKVLYHLCVLALRTGNLDEAIDYYDDFVQIAPKDPNQFILRYQILRAQGAPIEQQIEALEEFKKSEYREEWAFELAKLYQKADMMAECIEECDDLILWFSEGKYVYQAMELKMQYKPLSPSQQEKYSQRQKQLLAETAETEEMPDLATYAAKARGNEVPVPETSDEDDMLMEIEAADAEDISDNPEVIEIAEPESASASDSWDESSAKGSPENRMGDTMRLDEALKQLIRVNREEDPDPLSEKELQKVFEEKRKEMESDMADLEAEVDEIEAMVDLAKANQFAAEEKASNEEKNTVSNDLKELILDADAEDLEEELSEELPEELEEELSEELSEELTEELSEELTEELSEELTEELSEELTEELSEELTEELSEELTEELSEELTEELSEELSEELTEELSEELTEELSEELEEELSEELTEELSEELTEESGENQEEKLLGEQEKETVESETDISAAEAFLDEEDDEKTDVDSREMSDGAQTEKRSNLEDILDEWDSQDIEEFTGEDVIEKVESDEDKSESEEVGTEGPLEDGFEKQDEENEEEEVDESKMREEEIEESYDEEYEEYYEEESEDGYGDEYEYDDESEEEYGDEYEYDDESEDEYGDEYEYDDESEEEYEDEYEDEELQNTLTSLKTGEPILPPDIQRLIDEIEGVIPVEEEESEPDSYGKSDNIPKENMGKVADELRMDELDMEDEDDYEKDGYYDEDGLDVMYRRGADDSEYPESEDEYDEYYDDEDYEGEAPDWEEEFRVNPEHSYGPDDREIPDDDDDSLNILSSATTPLSRKETAKLIATGKTSPLPLDEISDALSMTDTGFIVHARYDLSGQNRKGPRQVLTEEQKKLFSYFVPVRGMSEQLVDVLEQDKNCTNRRGTSRTGNLLIIGNKGSGKTVLAVDVVKAIQKQRRIHQGKVAIVTGESLNKKKISDIFTKLHGGALIIEKAGTMDEKTVARLNKAMEKDTGEMLIVLEEQRKPLDRLLSSNREFRRKFTSRLEVPIFINDELVTFGQTYAQENGYRIDEMGILALYSKIDSLQREDHAVTVAEVKEIMDEAISHSQKASAKKLVKRVFGKNTDEEDRILLSERDFSI